MGVWIEISPNIKTGVFCAVTPYMGVWIEIVKFDTELVRLMSLPTWECGLKYFYTHLIFLITHVTPYMGVWIEISAPSLLFFSSSMSLPTWECGLK